MSEEIAVKILSHIADIDLSLFLMCIAIWLMLIFKNMGR